MANITYADPTLGTIELLTTELAGPVYLQRMAIAGSSGQLITGDAANGLDVDVTRVAAGANIVGSMRSVTGEIGEPAAAGALTVKQAAINITATGDTLIVAAVGGKKIRVLSITFTCAADTTIEFKSATNTKVQAMTFKSGGGMDVNRADHGWFVETNAGEALNMASSVATNIRGTLCYVEV